MLALACGGREQPADVDAPASAAATPTPATAAPAAPATPEARRPAITPAPAAPLAATTAAPPSPAAPAPPPAPTPTAAAPSAAAAAPAEATPPAEERRQRRALDERYRRSTCSALQDFGRAFTDAELRAESGEGDGAYLEPFVELFDGLRVAEARRLPVAARPVPD